MRFILNKFNNYIKKYTFLNKTNKQVNNVKINSIKKLNKSYYIDS